MSNALQSITAALNTIATELARTNQLLAQSLPQPAAAPDWQAAIAWRWRKQNGRKWLAFLDNRCPAAGLTRWMVLVEGAYKPECKLDDKAIAGLNQAVETWIRKHV